MVKGTARQVVVVRNPDQKLFEQAIFLLREEVLERGVGERELLEEARRIASRNLPHTPVKQRWTLPPLIWLCIGAIAVGIAWLMTAVI